jgi:molybdenum cofactor cytidylyltransferase
MLLLNQADDAGLVSAGLRIANTLTKTYQTIIISSLRNQTIHATVEPAAGIILAGGGASRFGQPKILATWRGKALVRHAAEAALAGGLDPVVVVLGAVRDPARQALEGLPVTFVENAEWQAGQSTSLRKGLQSLPARCGAAVFLLGDQPTVTKDVIQALVSRHQQTLTPVIAPRVMGRRANPALFDRDTFPDLLRLEGDTGGRAIFNWYPVAYLDWEDAGLLLDVDTPEDYQKLQGME